MGLGGRYGALNHTGLGVWLYLPIPNIPGARYFFYESSDQALEKLSGSAL